MFGETVIPNRHYTIVNHDVQRLFDISFTEYILTDLISKLCKQKGYCYMTKANMAKEINISERRIYQLITSLTDKGVIKSVGRGKLIALQPWDDWLSGMIKVPMKVKTFLDNWVARDEAEQSAVKESLKPEPELGFMKEPELECSKNMNLSSDNNKSNNKSSQKEKNTDMGDWGKVKDFYQERMTMVMNGEKPYIHWGKFTKLIKPIFDEWGVSRTVQALKGFFADPKIQQAKYPLPWFANNPMQFIELNKYDPKVGLGVEEYLERNSKLVDEARKRATSTGLPEDLCEDVSEVR